MNSALKTIRTWYEAFDRKDKKGMHDILSVGFRFRGPLTSFDSVVGDRIRSSEPFYDSKLFLAVS